MEITTKFESNNVSETLVSWDMNEVNRLLKEGWQILCAAVAHKDDFGYQAKPCWILGKK
jgi:hypothetical protein